MNRKNVMDKIKKLFVKFLFVEDIKCICCDNELSKPTRYGICDNCFKHLPFNNKKVCLKCGETIFSMADYCLRCKNNIDRNFDKARSPFIYKDEIIRLIHKLKYNNGKYLGKYLSAFIFDEFIKSGFNADVVIPVPLNVNRLKERGYNQSELLLGEFKKFGYNIDLINFVRIVDTPTQTKLSQQERQFNLKDAFKVLDTSVFKNKDILVIDDVFTTGSTMEHIAEVLKKAGANKVNCITLAHVLMEDKF